MKITLMGRGEGKTEQALAWLRNGSELPDHLMAGRWIPWSRVLLVAGHRRAEEARRQLVLLDPALRDHDYHLDRSPLLRAVLPAGPAAFPWIGPHSDVAIDDLDDVLTILVSRSVSWATMTETEGT